MTIPLIVLAVAAFFGGILNFPFHPHLVFLERCSPRWSDRRSSIRTTLPGRSGPSRWSRPCWRSRGSPPRTSCWRNTVDRPKLEPRFLLHAWLIDAPSTVHRPPEHCARHLQRDRHRHEGDRRAWCAVSRTSCVRAATGSARSRPVMSGTTHSASSRNRRSRRVLSDQGEGLRWATLNSRRSSASPPRRRRSGPSPS